MSRIPITIEVEPDFVIIREKDGAFTKHQYVFAHDFCIIADCLRDGATKSYSYPKYHGIRIKDGHVEWLNPSSGWQIDEQATLKYFEKAAEDTLLK